MILNRDFYNRETKTVAKELLGKIMVHHIDGLILKAKIVETEAYLGVEDKAAHSYGGKKTKRVEAMYGPPGHVYIYLIYGMYYCFNIVTESEGIPQAVLIRGIEPMENIEQMSLYRYNKSYEKLNNYQKKNLSNGPGKLSMAFNIDMDLNKEDLCGDRLYLEEKEKKDFNIIETTRIGIDYAEEAKDWLCRFYIDKNPYVSKVKS